MIKKSLVFLLLLPRILFAQEFTEPHYPQHYFRNPLDIPILLAGNFGELRPGHFHSGLDIKTDGHIGMKVHAAADGYISRVAVSATGFGNVIYITHPAGYTTVYGHLHRFNPALERYVKQKQYEAESWKMDLTLAPGLFSVRKGDFIAWSGSTGSSTAPHVHFEIRDTQTEHPLNGLLFGFDITDNIAPAVYRVALYDRNKSIYEQKPLTFALRKQHGEYVPSVSPIRVKTGKVGFGISAIDHENNTHNTYGVYEEILYDDDRPVIGFRLDDIGYEETRYVNAHVDYKTRREAGRYYELLFSLPGNRLEIYHDFSGNGTVDLSDGKVHAIKILVKDAYGNTSPVKLQVQMDASTTPVQKEACANRMYPGSKDIFENNQVQFYLDERALYDDICFQYSEIAPTRPGDYSGTYRLHTPDVPLHTSFMLHIRPTAPVADSLRDKLVIVRTEPRSKQKEAEHAAWEGDWLKASFSDFGDFAVQADTVPPVIVPVGFHANADLSRASRIAFRIRDELGYIKAYRAELDGQWLMFAQDGGIIYYTFDEHCGPGSHRLKLTVTDEADNQAVYLLDFKR